MIARDIRDVSPGCSCMPVADAALCSFAVFVTEVGGVNICLGLLICYHTGTRGNKINVGYPAKCMYNYYSCCA